MEREKGNILEGRRKKKSQTEEAQRYCLFVGVNRNVVSIEKTCKSLDD